MDEGLLSGLIPIDLKKAFDTVDHKTQTLEHSGNIGRGTHGLNPILATENSIVTLTVWVQI